jgi:hypothetical protein
LYFLLHCWFSWEPHNSQGQTFIYNAEAGKSNLSSKQVILLQNLTKKGEGHFPLAWNFKLLWVQAHRASLWFSSREPEGKKGGLAIFYWISPFPVSVRPLRKYSLQLLSA